MCLFVGLAMTNFARPGIAAEAAKEAEAPAPVALTNAVLQPVSFPKAMFSIDITAGKDPFFPTSLRRDPKPAVVEPVQPAPVAPPLTAPAIASMATNLAGLNPAIVAADATGKSYFKIKGLAAAKKRRFVTLHTAVKSYDFTTGDEMLLRVPDGTKRVRCLEIRPQSAVFQIEGEPEPIELFLRDDF